MIDELIRKDQIPSFCTACYRRGRTGTHFMEISVPGFIKNFCTPNAMLTLAEYLEDFASQATATKGWNLIERELARHNGSFRTNDIRRRLERIKTGERDIYF
jgi:2-iminoacetate synthase